MESLISLILSFLVQNRETVDLIADLSVPFFLIFFPVSVLLISALCYNILRVLKRIERKL
jgi:hypothetical protein